jgi:hypothetical protein
MSFMSAAMVVLELARVNSEFAGFFIIVTYLVMLSIEQCGSEEQKQKWLPRLASADAVGIFIHRSLIYRKILIVVRVVVCVVCVCVVWRRFVWTD